MNDLKAKLGDKAPNIPGIGDEALYNPFSYTLIARKSDAIYLFMMGDTSYKLTDANKLSIKKAMAKRLFSH